MKMFFAIHLWTSNAAYSDPLTAIRKIPLYFSTGRITMAAIREE
jgi:hypothetical protein